MLNELIFIASSLALTIFLVLALRIGKEALIALISLYGVLANLFVTKQIMIFGLNATASDAFAVATIIGLNVVQEYYGGILAKKTIWVNFLIVCIYTCATQLHLWYIPSSYDTTHEHFCALLECMPRITIASIVVFLITQHLDRLLYGWLQKKLSSNYFFLRNYASMVVCQLLDTILFSFLGLYGMVDNMADIILFSYAIKLISIALSTPGLALIKIIIQR